MKKNLKQKENEKDTLFYLIDKNLINKLAKTGRHDMKKEQGEKYDNDKLRFDLIPPESLEKLIEVYMHGADKYGKDNWRKGFKYSRIFSAIMRHLWAFWKGEDNDSDTGISHLAHAAWGCFTLIEFLEMHPDFDDRIPENYIKEEDYVKTED